MAAAAASRRSLGAAGARDGDRGAREELDRFEYARARAFVRDGGRFGDDGRGVTLPARGSRADGCPTSHESRLRRDEDSEGGRADARRRAHSRDICVIIIGYNK